MDIVIAYTHLQSSEITLEYLSVKLYSENNNNLVYHLILLISSNREGK